MEITERSLRQMVREVDDLHREGMKTIVDDIAELRSRRRFLRGAALTIGGAVLPVGLLVGTAAAQTPDDTTLAKFAESIELAAVAAYTAAAQTGKVKTPAVLAAMTAFAGHHQQHALAFGAFAGDTATAKPNPILLQTVGDLVKAAHDESEILKLAYSVENGAAATYLFAIGAFTSTQALTTTASILPVEAQHATVIGYVLGKDPTGDTDYLPPFQTPDQALQPAKYPLAG